MSEARGVDPRTAKRHSGPTERELEPRTAFFLALVLLVVLIVLDLLSIGPDESLIREGGAIDLSTALYYGIAAIFWLWFSNGTMWKRYWEIPALLFCFMGREFDIDKQLTQVGIFKTRLYFTSDPPILDKLLGIAILAACSLMGYRLLRSHWATFLAAMKQREAWAIAMLLAVSCLGVAVAIDGIARVLSDITSFTAGAVLVFEWVEELLELAVSLLLVFAVTSFAQSQQGRA